MLCLSTGSNNRNNSQHEDFIMDQRSYLADALRNVAVDGHTLWSQWDNLLGLAAWLAVTFLVAVRSFRWE